MSFDTNVDNYTVDELFQIIELDMYESSIDNVLDKVEE